MIIVRLLSPEPVGWLQHHQLYSGVGADIVMESIALVDWVPSPNACFRQLSHPVLINTSFRPRLITSGLPVILSKMQQQARDFPHGG
jgi:hypothetical protein